MHEGAACPIHGDLPLLRPLVSFLMSHEGALLQLAPAQEATLSDPHLVFSLGPFLVPGPPNLATPMWRGRKEYTNTCWRSYLLLHLFTVSVLLPVKARFPS